MRRASGLGLAIWGCGRRAPIVSGNAIAFPTPPSPSGCLCGDCDASTGAEAGIGERRGRAVARAMERKRRRRGEARACVCVCGCVGAWRASSSSLSPPPPSPGPERGVGYCSGPRSLAQVWTWMRELRWRRSTAAMGRGSGGRWEGAVCGLSLFPGPLNTHFPVR